MRREGENIWLIHNIGIGSVGGAASDTFTIIFVLVSIYRFGWKSLGENKFGKE